MWNKSKREFLKSIGTAGIFLAGVNLPVWAINTSARAASNSSSFDLLRPDENGLMLMKGFKSRIIAKSGEKIGRYKWHKFADGGATFKSNNGGWIYVSNSEKGDREGGVGAIKFNKNGKIIDSYQICKNTNRNCAGGLTPWNTWLSCEEAADGFTWECDPYGKRKQIKIKSLGMFTHEAAAVDPKTSIIYQTEDTMESGFYRFIPEKKIFRMGQLANTKGRFQVMKINANHSVIWNNVPDQLADYKNSKTKSLMKRKINKNINYTTFKRAEGAWYHDQKIYFSTTASHEIWTYDIKRNTCKVLYKRNKKSNLQDPDNLTVSKNGIVMAAEDRGNMEICGITKSGKAFPILRLPSHKKSELTGPAFDPSGNRLYFSSQKHKNSSFTFEVSGPFNEISI